MFVVISLVTSAHPQNPSCDENDCGDKNECQNEIGGKCPIDTDCVDCGGSNDIRADCQYTDDDCDDKSADCADNKIFHILSNFNCYCLNLLFI